MLGVRVTVTGLEHVATGGPFVYAPNHQSHLDILALLAHLPGAVRFAAKDSLWRYAVLGAVLDSLGMVPIAREESTKSIATLERVRDEGESFVVFPEGTRSRNGRLGEFKKGAFVLAIRLGLPVVPVTCRRDAAADAEGQPYDRRAGEVELIIDPPIPTAGLRSRIATRWRHACAPPSSSIIRGGDMTRRCARCGPAAREAWRSKRCHGRSPDRARSWWRSGAAASAAPTCTGGTVSCRCRHVCPGHEIAGDGGRRRRRRHLAAGRRPRGARGHRVVRRLPLVPGRHVQLLPRSIGIARHDDPRRLCRLRGIAGAPLLPGRRRRGLRDGRAVGAARRRRARRPDRAAFSSDSACWCSARARSGSWRWSAARAGGAGEILVTARRPQQRAAARALGADRGPRRRRRGRAARPPPRQPVDLVVETVGGGADTLDTAVTSCRPGGTVVVLGVFTKPVSVPGALLRRARSSRIQGSMVYNRVVVARRLRDRAGHAGAATASASARRWSPTASRSPTSTQAFHTAADKTSGSIKVTITGEAAG